MAVWVKSSEICKNLKIKPMKTAALFLTVLSSAAVWAQKPVTGYAPVNGLKMYYEIYGKGERISQLHQTRDFDGLETLRFRGRKT
jgi:hypothetical protein